MTKGTGLIRRRPTPAAPTEPAPVPTYSQTELRERRRQWLRVTYDAAFDLGREVSAILSPLAKAVAALPSPLVLRPEVDDVADAVHEVLSTVVGMLAESNGLDADARSRTATALRDLAQRPRLPEITDDAITSRRWSSALVRYVNTHTNDLSQFLGRALPPGHPRLSGPSASERLVDALRVLDTAARTLDNRASKAAARQALPSMAEYNAAQRERIDRKRTERAMSKLTTKIGAPRP